MFLKRLKLKNFRGFTSNELCFATGEDGTESRKTTILLGGNGIGKSSILKAIALVTSGRDALAQLVEEPESWIQKGKRYCLVEATLQNQDGDEREISVRIEKGDGVSDVLDRTRDSLKLLEDALDYTNRSYFVLAYGASRRLSRATNRGGRKSMYRHPRAQRLATLFDSDASLVSVESWAMDVDYQRKRGAMSLIKAVLSDFLKEVNFKRIDKAKGQLLFDTPLGEVPMSQLSDGYQNIAAWVGDLLYRITETFEDYDNPLSTRGLLLIDEIDLHLHPSWQRELLQFLQERLPNFQIVATTHSPVTAQQAQSGELFSLHRKGKKVSIEPFVGDPRALLLHQLITSDLFGVESDESLSRQKMKSRYEKLAGLKRLSKAQKTELAEIKEELAVTSTRLRSHVQMSNDHVALLKKIQSELEGRAS